MTGLPRPILRRWPLWAAVASAAMLAIAHAFESFGGLQPCTLCLRQREVYWAAIAIGIVGVVLQRTPGRAWMVRLVCAVLAVTFLVGMGVAIYHAGAEWKWWPGPQACSSTGAGIGDITAMLNGAKVAPPRCDEAPWVFLGLSMAGWNALISLGLAAFSAWAACSTPWVSRIERPVVA